MKCFDMRHGRLRRAVTFPKVAIDFNRRVQAGKISPLKSDGRTVFVEERKCVGRAILKNASHLSLLKKLKKDYLSFIGREGIKPQHYSLTWLLSCKDVQEYVEKPTVSMLRNYFSLKQGTWSTFKYKTPSTRREYMLCKKFVNESKDKGFSQSTMERAFGELRQHLRINRQNVSSSNVIVMGYQKATTEERERVRLAIIDGL